MNDRAAIDELRAQTCAANLRLPAEHLVKLTWGNVSVRAGTLCCIKPSGVPYGEMQPSDMVLLDVATGAVISGDRRPSTDAHTHLELYRAFPDIGAIVHAHSPQATAFAQARRPIACFGTTHADHFAGPVSVTRPLNEREARSRYEYSSGVVIIEHLRARTASVLEIPAVLLAGHAPFVWGASAKSAVDNAVALEECARIAALTLALEPAAGPLEPWLLEVHHKRKHGDNAYYGQDTER